MTDTFNKPVDVRRDAAQSVQHRRLVRVGNVYYDASTQDPLYYELPKV